jgi:hypothetical protein
MNHTSDVAKADTGKRPTTETERRVSFVDVPTVSRLSAERRRHQVFTGAVRDKPALRIELSIAG